MKEVSLSRKSQMACWWCGVWSFILFFLSIWPLMGMIPPPDPAWSGESVRDSIFSNVFNYRVGTILGLIAGSLLLPWSALVAYQVSRMESGRPPVLASICFGGGIVNALVTIFPFTIWSGAAYRAERAPDEIRLLNDINWLDFMMVWPPFVVYLVPLGVAALISTSRVSVLPRWYGYFTLWLSLTMAGGAIAILFFDGPFAWNGLIGWWMVVIMFALYWLVSFPIFRGSIVDETREVAA